MDLKTTPDQPAAEPRSRLQRWRDEHLFSRIVAGIGRTMMTAGALILLFVAYQLWGTNIHNNRAQDRLENEFNAKLEALAGDTTTTTTATPGTLPATTAAPIPIAAENGDPVGKIEIPKIGLTAYIVQGVTDEDLKNGPGHYETTPFPGQAGNSGVAGHRTTYGAPFADIDDLAVGDLMRVTTVQGTFSYEVIPAEDGNGSGHMIVSPGAVEVLDDKGDNRLTLTACHPKYSAAERIIVAGRLVGEPLPAQPVQEEPASLSGDRGGKGPLVAWGLLCAAIWIGAWLLGKRWRKWPAYGIGVLPFLLCLFFFFEEFSAVLPANY